RMHGDRCGSRNVLSGAAKRCLTIRSARTPERAVEAAKKKRPAGRFRIMICSARAVLLGRFRLKLAMPVALCRGGYQRATTRSHHAWPVALLQQFIKEPAANAVTHQKLINRIDCNTIGNRWFDQSSILHK